MVAFLLIAAGYVAIPFPFISASSVDDVHECVIRWLYGHNDSGAQGEIRVCFIGIGTSFNPKDSDFTPRDPSHDFMTRLADMPVTTLPITHGINAVDRGAIGGYAVDSSGRRGLMLAAGNVSRWSVGITRCKALYYEGGLSSAGYEVIVLRVPFKWIPIWSRIMWMS